MFHVKRASDGFERLQEIERAAGALFRDAGMAAIAGDDPPSLEEFAEYARAGYLWCAADADGRAVAYLMAGPVDGNLHVEQVTVDPAYARRGIGLSLITHAAESARRAGMVALTLTTYRDIPWNGPYYRRCGFRELTDSEIGPELRAIRIREQERGLDRWPRICMRLDL